MPFAFERRPSMMPGCPPVRIGAALLVSLAAALLPTPARGQVSDTARAAEAARRAQRQFESVRRGALPFTESRGGKRCDVSIGTFCYWYDPAATRPPGEEHPRVVAARQTLLAQLDALGRAVPASGEIAGQRVRYRLEAGDTTAAVRVAESDCRAARWWCAALVGFARHAASDHRGAEAAYDAALAAMDSARRCEWEDVSILLPRKARARLRALRCPERMSASRRIHWLSTPLLATGANDVRTEILARRTAAMLHAHVAPLNDTRPRSDASETLLRFGRSEWWTRERPLGSVIETAQVISHERVPSFGFLPSERVLLDSAATPAPADWAPTADAPSTRYAPAYAHSWREIPAQLARFAQGDSMVIAVAFDASGDTALRNPVATLAWSGGVGDSAVRSPSIRSARGALQLGVARPRSGRYGLADVSVIDTAMHGVARHRSGVADFHIGRPLGVSDLLLFAPAQPERRDVVMTRDDAVAAALPSLRTAQPELGVYWESYATAELPGPVAVSLIVERTGRSWLARAAVRAGVSERDRPVRIGWQLPPPAPGAIVSRSVVLNLRELQDGEYLVRLTERAPDGAVATSERRVVLARAP